MFTVWHVDLVHREKVNAFMYWNCLVITLYISLENSCVLIKTNFKLEVNYFDFSNKTINNLKKSMLSILCFIYVNVISIFIFGLNKKFFNLI